jgi:ubiquinone/menaquinone biosynthesis C-methylase UbiE
MNHPLRRFLQRKIEYLIFRRMGLEPKGKDILEIGCGSGYGAYLLHESNPRSYLGIDVMPEQIALAKSRSLSDAEFIVHDATDLGIIPDGTKDMIVIFGILHHIPEWKKVIEECRRILRHYGEMYVEEPDGKHVRHFDRIFHWGHPEPALFTLKEFESHLAKLGLIMVCRKQVLMFGFYRVRKMQA